MRLLLKRAKVVRNITAWLMQLRCNVDNGVKMRFQSLKNEGTGMIGRARHDSAIPLLRNSCALVHGMA
jgi:hypothetical protein